MVTLHHFTDPLWLARTGGWENPHVVDLFCRFVTRVVDALGDRVTFLVYDQRTDRVCVLRVPHGLLPSRRAELAAALGVLRSMLLAHGRAYRLIHRLQTNAQVGLAHNMQVMLPANPDSAADRRAAALLDQIGEPAPR